MHLIKCFVEPKLILSMNRTTNLFVDVEAVTTRRATDLPVHTVGLVARVPRPSPVVSHSRMAILFPVKAQSLEEASRMSRRGLSEKHLRVPAPRVASDSRTKAADAHPTDTKVGSILIIPGSIAGSVARYTIEGWLELVKHWSSQSYGRI